MRIFLLTVPGCHASSGLLTLNINALNVCHRIEGKPVRIAIEQVNFDRILRFSHGKGDAASPTGQRLKTEHLDFDSLMRFSLPE